MNDTLTSEPSLPSDAVGRRHSLLLADDRLLELRRMRRWDRHAVVSFLRGLGADSRPWVPNVDRECDVDDWISEIESGRAASLLLSAGDRIVGCLSLSRGGIFSTEQSHEMSLAIARGWPTIELAEHLWRAAMADLPNFGARKLVALMTPEQTGERAALEHVGFFAEGLLADYVIDEAGHTHDLVIMARVLQQPFVLQRGYARAVAPCRSLAIATNRSVVIVNLVHAAVADDGDWIAPAPPPQREFAHAAYRRAVKAPSSRRGRSAARALSVVGVLSLALVLFAGVVSFRERPGVTRESQVLAEGAVPARSASSFSASHVGTGAVFLAATSTAIDVLVALPETADAGWFWCVESSFGMPLVEHHCGSSVEARAGPTGDLLTDAIVHIDPSWPADARYFVAMYCPGPCTWHVTATADAQVATR